MIALIQSVETENDIHKIPTSVESSEPTVLSDIYQSSKNMAIWQRTNSNQIDNTVDKILESKKSLKLVIEVTPQSTQTDLQRVLGELDSDKVLSSDIAKLVDMFCYLFELESVGLRLTALQESMCPRFHVDKVDCRLITTYKGNGTQWLPHEIVDRSKLGAGNKGLNDDLSGIYKKEIDIKNLACGDVALLKGEAWIGNENAGIVHRSPPVAKEETRLVLTLDILP